MAAKVSWDPNRYGSVKKVLQYDEATGKYSIADQDHNYTGVNYTFTSLPEEIAPQQLLTSEDSNKTTEMQTTEAFGDVRPWWLKQQDAEGSDNTNIFSGVQENQPVTELTGFFDPLDKAMSGQKPPLGDRLRHQFADLTGQTNREWENVDRALAGETEQPGKFRQTISDFGSAIKTRARSLLDRPIPFIPGMTFLQAANRVLRPGANKSFRNIPGLYNTEINLMRRYGSTGATDMNPTGDPRKDDAGFNIVSMSGNYNKIGTNSRRHNMLKVADNIIDPIERKKARNKIRADWKEEKDSGIENKSYNIDSSGSADKAPAETKSKPTKTYSSPARPHGNGGNQGNTGGMGKGQSPSDAPGSPF